MFADTDSPSRHMFSREVCQKLPYPLEQRARGIPGARCTRSVACKIIRSTRHSHHGHTGFTRHSPRNGLRLISRSPRRPGSFATVAGGIASTDLTPASGCQDHTFLPSASERSRQQRSLRPPHPAPHVDDVAQRPSYRVGMARACRDDLPDGESEIFFDKGLDRNSAEQSAGD
jgi:hypothetical protein